MKLVNVEYGIDLELTENRVNVLVVENPRVLEQIVGELYSQSQDGEGQFVLAEKEKILKISKEVVLVLEPFTIDCNEKRILTKLYQELKVQMDDAMIEERVKLNEIIVNYLDKAVMKLPYSIIYRTEFDILGLCKLFGVELEHSADTLCERIIEYLRALSQLCGCCTVIFLNLKSFLMLEEIQSLYEFVVYHKINLILVENIMRDKLEFEKICIIDKDRCIIDL